MAKKQTPAEQREALGRIGIINGWDLLKKFGDDNDCIVDYSAKPAGRMGIVAYNHSTAWSLRDGKGWRKEFLGNRDVSLPAATAWAEKRTGRKLVKAPLITRCLVTEDVLKRALAEANKETTK